MNRILLKIVLIILLMALPAMTWVSIWGKNGTVGKQKERLKVYNQTVKMKKKPCVVCSKPGKVIEYLKVGPGVGNPFAYKGPYIYCPIHTKPKPMSPITPKAISLKRIITSIVTCVFLVSMATVLFSKKLHKEVEGVDGWLFLGVVIFLFFVFFI